MFCSFPDPHHPWTPPGRYWDHYRPDDIELRPEFWKADAHVDVKHLAWYYAQREARAAQAQVAGVPAAYACGEREAREAIALTYGMLSMIDDAVGRIGAELERLGLARDTVIVYTSDHGDYMGDHQMLLKSVLHYQGLVRTPMIWADPAATGAGTHRTALTGAIDLTRTILDRAQVAPANGTQGHSLLPLIASETEQVRDALLIEDESARPTTWLGRRARVRTLVTVRHRMSLYHGSDWGELYDLDSDPLELRNLWSDPGSARLRAALTEQLAQQMLGHGDTSPRPTAFA
jgi:arylsulfatase A-like enzyme